MNSAVQHRLRTGSDICSVERISRVYQRYGSRFLDKILTSAEKIYVCSKAGKGNSTRCHARMTESIAGRFAAKEAIAKALGTGWSGISWLEVEILNAESGAPSVVLHGRAAVLFAELKCKGIEISISHEREFAFAVALLY